jgi:signal transduction histidine kinase
MLNLKTKIIPCPNCNQLVSRDERVCPHCNSDLAIAAVIAERAMSTTPLFADRAAAPEMLVTRVGDLLVQQGFLAEADLYRALDIQKERSQEGENILIGQLLIEMGLISRDALDKVVTEHILQLQEALTQSNQRLENQVQRRTSQLQNALAKLAELNQLKLNFISNISHELRMPMQFLIGYLDLMGNGTLGQLTDQQTKAVDSMMGASGQLQGLIENLLQFSAAADGTLPLDMAPLTLDLPVNTAVSHTQPKAFAREITLNNDLYPRMPKVIADNQKITWVVEQFLDNAIKFTPSGGIVRIETTPVHGDVTVKVTDTGIGIPQNRIDEIFEPFHQLDGSTTRSYGGTGLGLALARNIVEAHGSTISVDSQVGEGTCFSFALPALS